MLWNTRVIGRKNTRERDWTVHFKAGDWKAKIKRWWFKGSIRKGLEGKTIKSMIGRQGGGWLEGKTREGLEGEKIKRRIRRQVRWWLEGK